MSNEKPKREYPCAEEVSALEKAISRLPKAEQAKMWKCLAELATDHNYELIHGQCSLCLSQDDCSIAVLPDGTPCAERRPIRTLGSREGES